MVDKVYLALYCPSAYESGWVTLSIHKTRKGALKAIIMHRRAQIKENVEANALNPEFDTPESYAAAGWGNIDARSMVLEDQSWKIGEKDILE